MRRRPRGHVPPLRSSHQVVDDSVGTPPDTEGAPMTDTHDAVISEALAVIDKALGQLMQRELVSAGEVTDVLLDVRSLLTAPVPAPH